MNAKGESIVAVVIPCYNESQTIAKVTRDFLRVLPEAGVYVFDNNSNDGSSDIALAAGAQVRSVRQQGKGNVIRRMFADLQADIYVLVDGDDTYDAEAARDLVNQLIAERLDMVVGCRIAEAADTYPQGHVLGNRMFSRFLSILFGRSCRDVFSGYRVFSRRFAKSFPAQSIGFEIETELTVHALELKMPIAERDTVYRQRPEGSASKLNTYRDGWRILMTMLRLFRIERPLVFFGLFSGTLAFFAVVLAIPLMATYLDTGLVPRFPTAILSTGLMLLAALSLFAGLIIDNVTLGRRESRVLAYLTHPAPWD
jgi:glycosyltransferase involved in cell wall biosynthesis